MRISARTSPASSATPTPTMAMMITPTALKPMKLATTPVYMNRMPSMVSSPRASVAMRSMSPVAGL